MNCFQTAPSLPSVRVATASYCCVIFLFIVFICVCMFSLGFYWKKTDQWKAFITIAPAVHTYTHVYACTKWSVLYYSGAEEINFFFFLNEIHKQKCNILLWNAFSFTVFNLCYRKGKKQLRLTEHFVPNFCFLNLPYCTSNYRILAATAVSRAWCNCFIKHYLFA